jgi:HD-GYP domain-containing protein (c-di-GMP phosphodiesterase class II)
MGVVDIYDAVTSQRPYQEAKSIDEALGVLNDHVNRGWRRRDLVDGFESLVRSGKVGPVGPATSPSASAR